MSRPPGPRTTPLERFTARLTLAGAALVVVIVVFGVVIALVRTKWAPLNRLDVRISDDLSHYFSRHPGWAGFWRGVTNAGQPLVFEVLSTIAAALMWRARQRRLALFTVVTVWGAGLIGSLTKLLVGRARPPVAMRLVHANGASFPSGHALTSSVALALLVVLAWPRVSRPWAVALAVGAALVAAAVGFSRMALDVHYLSDIVGAWLLGATWLLAMIGAFRIARRPES